MLDWLKCNICFNTYNDSAKRPRTLHCGHTFCESCLSATIQNETLTCARCRKVHSLISASELTVNYDLEGILKSLNLNAQGDNEDVSTRTINGESDCSDESKVFGSVKSLLDQQERSLSAQKEIHKTSAGLCHDHPSCELKFRCSLHKCWVCEKCRDVKGDHPNNKCVTITFKDEIEGRKQEHKNQLEERRQSLSETLSSIETHISDLNADRLSRVELIKLLQDLTRLHVEEEMKLKNEIESFQKMLHDGKQVIQSLMDVDTCISKAVTLDESNIARDTVYNKTEEVKNWENQSEKDVNEGKVVLQQAVYSLMASSKALEYRSIITKTPEGNGGLILQALEEIKHGPIKNAANQIRSEDIQFTLRSLNIIINSNKDDLNNVTNQINASWNCEEITTKVQLILLSFLSKVLNNEDFVHNTWAVQNLKDCNYERAGLISRINGRIAIHSLQPVEEIPKNAITIPFEPLLQLYNTKSIVFLSMKKGFFNKGMVHIKLFDEASLGKAMLKYCTGEEGWSYQNKLLNTNFSSNGSKDWICFWPNEIMNPLPSSLKQDCEPQPTYLSEDGLLTPAVKGKEVCNDGTFGVILKAKSGERQAFGKVVNGLSVIKEVDTEKRIYISDCGIII